MKSWHWAWCRRSLMTPYRLLIIPMSEPASSISRRANRPKAWTERQHLLVPRSNVVELEPAHHGTIVMIHNNMALNLAGGVVPNTRTSVAAAFRDAHPCIRLEFWVAPDLTCEWRNGRLPTWCQRIPQQTPHKSSPP